MNLEQVKNAIPSYAKDIKLNLSSLLNEETLTEQQLWGTFLASALASGSETLIRAIEQDAAQHLSADALEASKAANAIMAMNNVYYKFAGYVEAYSTLPAKLRMNVIGNPGVEKEDFELWSLAVSAINGCQFCVKAHEGVLTKAGIEKPQIQTAVRIAAVVHAVANVIETDAALSGDMAEAA